MPVGAERPLGGGGTISEVLLASFHVTIGSRHRMRVPAEICRAFGSELTWSLDSAAPHGVIRPGWRYDAEIEAAIASRNPLSREARLLRQWFSANAWDFELRDHARVDVPFALLGEDADPGPRRVVLLCVGGRAAVLPLRMWETLRELGAAESYVTRLRPTSSLTAPIAGTEVGDAVVEAVLRQLFDAPELTVEMFRAGRRMELWAAGGLEAADFGLVELTQPSHDGGIDLIVHLRGGGHNNLLYVQCKSGLRKPTVTDIRELIGVVARDGARSGLLISSVSATDLANEEARVSKVPVAATTSIRLAEWVDGFAPPRATAEQ